MAVLALARLRIRRKQIRVLISTLRHDDGVELTIVSKRHSKDI